MLFLDVAMGLITLTLAVVQLLGAFDVVQVPEGAASPFVRNSNSRGVKVAMALWMAFIGVAFLVIGLMS